MSAVGFTMARSMGPVAQVVEWAGGNVARVFRRAELPLRLVDEPNRLILLKDQLALVECAAREIGDDALPLRLSLEAGWRGLGAFGDWVSAAPTLETAILRCNETIGAMLQTQTHLRLERRGAMARWTYEISDSAAIGRQKNELLAIGYMTDALRLFLGPAGAATYVETPAPAPGQLGMQRMLGCELRLGAKAALIFPVELLEMENIFSRSRTDVRQAPTAATPGDFVAGVRELIRLRLLEGQPTAGYVGRKLGLSVRSLQRRLAADGARFETLRDEALKMLAGDLLRPGGPSILEIAYELGYSDPAHFTRAFIRWTGETPRDYRRRPTVDDAGGER